MHKHVCNKFSFPFFLGKPFYFIKQTGNYVLFCKALMIKKDNNTNFNSQVQVIVYFMCPVLDYTCYYYCYFILK